MQKLVGLAHFQVPPNLYSFLFPGEAFAKKNDEIVFIKKKTCNDVQLNLGENYLIMGKEALKTGDGASIK